MRACVGVRNAMRIESLRILQPLFCYPLRVNDRSWGDICFLRYWLLVVILNTLLSQLFCYHCCYLFRVSSVKFDCIHSLSLACPSARRALIKHNKWQNVRVHQQTRLCTTASLPLRSSALFSSARSSPHVTFNPCRECTATHRCQSRPIPS